MYTYHHMFFYICNVIYIHGLINNQLKVKIYTNDYSRKLMGEIIVYGLLFTL